MRETKENHEINETTVITTIEVTIVDAAALEWAPSTSLLTMVLLVMKNVRVDLLLENALARVTSQMSRPIQLKPTIITVDIKAVTIIVKAPSLRQENNLQEEEVVIIKTSLHTTRIGKETSSNNARGQSICLDRVLAPGLVQYPG